jgi:hypothetical protein
MCTADAGDNLADYRVKLIATSTEEGEVRVKSAASGGKSLCEESIRVAAQISHGIEQRWCVRR